MKNYAVYILRCVDNSFYTGVTGNLEKRVLEHQAGKHPKSYTFKRRPIELVYFESFQEVIQAIQCEKQIKGWSRAKKQALIEENWDKIVELAKRRSLKVLDKGASYDVGLILRVLVSECNERSRRQSAERRLAMPPEHYALWTSFEGLRRTGFSMTNNLVGIA